jgi:hypothetical protein
MSNMEMLVGQLMDRRRMLDVAKKEAQVLYGTYSSLPESSDEDGAKGKAWYTYTEKRGKVRDLQTQIDDLLVGRKENSPNLQTPEARQMINQKSPGADTWMNVPSYDQSSRVWVSETPKWKPQPVPVPVNRSMWNKLGFRGGVRTQRSKKRSKKRSNKKRTRRSNKKRTRMKRSNKKRTGRSKKRNNKKRTRRS